MTELLHIHNTAAAPLVTLGVAAVTRKAVALVEVEPETLAVQAPDGTLDAIAERRDTSTLPLGASSAWPAWGESLRSDSVDRWSELVASAADAGCPDALRAVATVGPDGVQRTPWLVTMGGQQSVGSIVADTIATFRLVSDEAIEAWAAGNTIPARVTGFHGAWMDTAAAIEATVPGIESRWSGDPIATWLALAGLFTLPHHNLGWGRISAVRARGERQFRGITRLGAPTGLVCAWPLFERAPLPKLIDQWMELELTLTRGRAPVRFGVTARSHPRAISDMTRFAGLLSGRLLDRDEGAEPADRVPVGAGEIASMIGVTPNTVQVWTSRHDSFPAPAFELGGQRVWWWDDVEAWALATGRLP